MDSILEKASALRIGSEVIEEKVTFFCGNNSATNGWLEVINLLQAATTQSQGLSSMLSDLYIFPISDRGVKINSMRIAPSTIIHLYKMEKYGVVLDRKTLIDLFVAIKATLTAFRGEIEGIEEMIFDEKSKTATLKCGDFAKSRWIGKSGINIKRLNKALGYFGWIILIR